MRLKVKLYSNLHIQGRVFFQNGQGQVEVCRQGCTLSHESVVNYILKVFLGLCLVESAHYLLMGVDSHPLLTGQVPGQLADAEPLSLCVLCH